MDNFNPEENIQSEWNSNKASLMRIDYDIRMIAGARYSDDLHSYFKLLGALRFEAKYKMNDKLKKECEERYKTLENYDEMYTKGKKDQRISLWYRSKLDDYFDFLVEFMGQKGMLITERDTKGL
jgi:hypothetical protein